MTTKQTKKTINRDELELTDYEKELEADFEKGYFKEIPNVKKEMAKIQRIAKNSIAQRTATSTTITRPKEQRKEIEKAAKKKNMPLKNFVKSVVSQHIQGLQKA